MGKFTVSRRAVLRGIGGATIALPPLEIMSGPRQARGATAAGIPRRFCPMWGGISIGGGWRGFAEQNSFPIIPGVDWELTRGLAPIGGSKPVDGGPAWKDAKGATRQSVKADVGVVSRLAIPQGEPWNGGVHGSSDMPSLAGAPAHGTPPGGTADQIVADALSVGSSGRHSIALAVQPHPYSERNESSGPNPVDTRGSQMIAEISPVNAFNAVFDMSKLATSDPATYMKLATRRKSVVDLVRDNAMSMVSRLGGEDRRRMQKYFAEVNDLETRLANFKNDQSCHLPTLPAADPPEGGVYTYDEQLAYTPEAEKEIALRLWSNETLRGELMTDVIALAFQCNITPVAFLRITTTKSFMLAKSFTGAQTGLHGLTHGTSPVEVADAIAWHVNIFAGLVAKLKAMPESDGSTVLDHTVLALLFEGGAGHIDTEEVPEAVKQEARFGPNLRWAHSCDEMMVVYAGGQALGLNATHIVCDDQPYGGVASPNASKHNPAEVMLTLMNALGVRGPLGMATKIVPGMGVAPLQ